MKSLVLCRHAKSNWKYHTDDIYRPLNKRGIADAPRMANSWSGARPDIVLCSPAVRAYSTALAYIGENAWPLTLLRLEQALFEAGPDTLLKVLSGVDDEVQDVWLFGHNPGLNLLTETLTGAQCDNIVTAARVHLALTIAHWRDIQPYCGEVRQRVAPQTALFKHEAD